MKPAAEPPNHCLHATGETLWTFKFRHRSGQERTGKVFLPAGSKPEGKIAAIYGDLFHPDHYGVWDLKSEKLTA